jgi:hypothetical protein
MQRKKRNPGAGKATGEREGDLLGGKIETENSLSQARSQAGRRSRRKGVRVEQEIVNLHRQFGIKAERVPLSGGSAYQGKGHDIDIYGYGADANPLMAEVKARKNGSGFATLARWLADNDCLILRADNSEPLFVLPLRVWMQLLDRSARG